MMLGSTAQAADFTKVTDLAYGTDKLQRVDVYTPPSCQRGGCPVIMWVHGGGWSHGSKNMRSTAQLAATWCAAGAVLVAVDYRLSPDVMHPAHVEDIAASINWVRQNIQAYGGNPARIYLLGHSAGAHLVALVGTDPQYLGKYGLTPAEALAGVFPIDSASYDLNASSRDLFVGRLVRGAFGEDRKILSAASPLDWVSQNRHQSYPPFILAAVKQRPDAVFQMNEMVEALQRAGGSAQAMVVDYPGQRQLQAHGSIARDLTNSSHAMTKRLMAEMGLHP